MLLVGRFGNIRAKGPTAYRYFRYHITQWYFGGALKTGGVDASGTDTRVGELEYVVSGTSYPTSDMTSASAPSPLVATWSTDDGSRPGWRCFDGNPGDGNRWISNTAGAVQWVVIDLGSGNEIAIDSYKLAPDGAASIGYHPATWTIEGSNTGSFAGEEDILDTQTDVSSGWTNNTLRTFTL